MFDFNTEILQCNVMYSYQMLCSCGSLCIMPTNLSSVNSVMSMSAELRPWHHYGRMVHLNLKIQCGEDQQTESQTLVDRHVLLGYLLCCDYFPLTDIHLVLRFQQCNSCQKYF